PLKQRAQRIEPLGSSPPHLVINMKPINRFHLTSCARAIAACSLAFMVAACGSSDDDDETPATEVPTDPAPAPEPTPESLRLSLLGRFETNQFGVSAAEIP